MISAIRVLENPDQGRAPRDNASPSRLVLAGEVPPAPADDSAQGLALFVIFSSAVLLVTCAVAFLALFTSWWVLGFVFGIHVLVTAVVGKAVFAALDNGKPGSEGDSVWRDEAMPSLAAGAQTPSAEASPIAA